MGHKADRQREQRDRNSERRQQGLWIHDKAFGSERANRIRHDRYLESSLDQIKLRALLDALEQGRITQQELVAELNHRPYADIGSAKLDIHRESRVGVPEVIFGPGKSAEQVGRIASELASRTDGAVLVTRATPEQFSQVLDVLPEAEFFPDAKVIVGRRSPSEPLGVVLVVSAGTSDQAVAEEAVVTLDALGIKVERLRDVGVAGVHRLLASEDALVRADVIIVVAGMDGALVSIIGGLAAAPVIAVPTSVGYGAGAGGIAPLLTMLNSCAPGVAVVNIDNGFGAAAFAAKLLRRRT